MGNKCHEEPPISRDQKRLTYFISYAQNLHISNIVRENGTQEEKQYEIGFFFDQKNVNQTLKAWQNLFEGQVIEGNVRDLQNAFYTMHRKKPLQFNEILMKNGGGPIRWLIWKTIFKSQLSEQIPLGRDFEISKADILRDVTRTFPKQYIQYECLLYFQKNPESVNKLSDLLGMSCSIFKSFSYTQGMNYIMALILMQAGGDLNEAWLGAYSIMTQPKWMMYLMYVDEFPLQSMIGKITMDLLKQQDIQLYHHYIKLGIEDAFILSKWCFTLYTYNMELNKALQLWDLIVSKGIFIMPYINVAIFMSLKFQILACRDDGELQDLFHNDFEFVLDKQFLGKIVIDKKLIQKHSTSELKDIFKHIKKEEFEEAYFKYLSNYLQ